MSKVSKLHSSVSSSFCHRFNQAIRTMAVGALGAFALGSMIQPAQAGNPELTYYKINWEGSNGYSMSGSLSVDSSVPSTQIDASQIWDMSVSFFDSEHQLLNSFVQKESGVQVYGDLKFSFDREGMLVNQRCIDLGSDMGDLLNEFYLSNPDGLALYSVNQDRYVSLGGTVTISLDGESTPTEPTNTAPTLHLPESPIVVEANFPGGAYVTFETTASDLEDEVAPSVTTTPVSGSVFGLGDTTVEASATDLGGLTGTGSFVVRVQDTTGPVIGFYGCSSTLTVAVGTEFNDYGVYAYDAVDQYVNVTSCGTVDTNTVGTYSITYKAKDCRGNEATPVTRVVNVVDPMPEIPKRRFSGGNYDAQGLFNISAQGYATASLNINSQTYRSLFKFNERANEVVFRGTKGATVNANVYASVDNDGEPVIIVETPTTTLNLKATMYTNAKPAPATVAGTYTAVLRGQGGVDILSTNESTEQKTSIGSGFATFTVARDGRVRVIGRTAEGTAISASSYLVRPPKCGDIIGPVGITGTDTVTPSAKTATTATTNSEVSVNNIEEPSYAPAAQFHIYGGLYKPTKRGSFGAIFTLDRCNPYGSISGDFHWSAPQGALKLYPQGFDVWGYSFGGRFERAVPAGQTGLEFSFLDAKPFVAYGNVTDYPVFYDITSVQGDPTVAKLRCRYTSGTGMLMGTGFRGNGSAVRSFQAIWLQEQGIIEGFAVSGDAKSNGIVQLAVPEVPEVPPQPPLPEIPNLPELPQIPD